MTPQEILKEYKLKKKVPLIKYLSNKQVYEAMEEYAQQEAEGFAEWLNDNSYIGSLIKGQYLLGRDLHTTSELFNLYKNRK